MRIEHVAIWVTDLEQSREFFNRYFNATTGERYENPTRQFVSYFLTFPDDGARLELMAKPGLDAAKAESIGWAHLAISLGSETAVDALALRLTNEGYRVVDGPRRTGDGYYEAVVLGPDEIRIEITV